MKPSKNQRFIAFTTKGLENITEKEINYKFPNTTTEVLTKRVIFSSNNISPKSLVELKTADDVHVLLKSFDAENEDFILDNVPIDEIKEAIEYISQFRRLEKNFSITLSKYKNRTIDLESLESNVSKIMMKKLGMNYTPRNRTNLDIRIYAEGPNILFSCRIPAVSLYNRKYRKCEKMGALKPTIAAALCFLVSPKKDERVVDNFCGTGTILCEAFLQGLEPYGGDINDECVECAAKNITSISPERAKNIKVLDAKLTKWPDSYFDYAISNLPWGKQVELKGVVKLYSASIKEYARILKKDGSIVLLGMKPDLIIKHLKMNFPEHEIIKFRIGFLGQTPWVVCALTRNKPRLSP